MSSPETPRPRWTGFRRLDDHGESLVLGFNHHNVHFSVVVASIDDAAGEALAPEDYYFDNSIEGKILIELSELSTYDSDKPWPKENQEASRRLEKHLADLAVDACLATMQQLAPYPKPAARTLQEALYPTSYALQIFTEGDKLACRTLHDYTGIAERHPAIPSERLRDMGLDLETTDRRVIKASDVILVRHLQNFAWKVTVDGEEMVCKTSLDIIEHAIAEELATYLKIRSAAGVELRVPKLKGLISSHLGIIGILLTHIPHKHHSLRTLLAGIKDGTVPPSEATPSLRQKWARQIRETVAGLHGLGILWRDVKTDNVLIDEGGDAVVLDFGGGNTVGWVDHEKYGTMEGEEQGMGKIMEVLGV
ncbi:hypothetical protein NEMBOFW57_009600 [Staphylotrichum longicolle]|uniref:Protein kinase domain-containing protein n=1 Tax=Staphylotrichum longicolle TaxID=669026 RepID=A0AAD4EPB5_9PEZI|nr:hypothetical protein NEMBOFW57_009600 [Staphylotrichum longicolle]